LTSADGTPFEPTVPIVVLLSGGGTKQRQQNDIGVAVDLWKDYKRGRGAEKQQGTKRQQGEE